MDQHKKTGHPDEKGAPITKKEQVHHNPDNKIDQDYPDFPHGQSKPELINPKTKSDKEAADLGKVDGDKVNEQDGGEEEGDDEQRSDGSGGAFASTEEVSDEYDVFDYELRALK